MRNLQVTWGLDIKNHDRCEYIVYENDEIIAREGGFKGHATAKRKGLAKAKEILANDPQMEMEV